MGIILSKSLETKKPIQVIYLSSRGEITQRPIIVLKKSAESITARCLLKGELRVFKLERILSAGFLSHSRK
ncbi:hypothetical protein CEF21_09950 [Bacillus sp. FJAT-42376]|uniref:WYL domain-containing protein n=1 Tax=Bacillus sp. FJAT-42376 TaxID=2014076 RepID=UPI000F4D9160|nr:hypothetical protein [Bacillus sp. FJAT-42376]AZB42583.1 hypothetical protein CEF21_09950 [Bacillus sp. FJAT-42376]